MKHIIRSLGTSMAVVSVMGVASMGTAAAASISNTGPGSFNQINVSSGMRFNSVRHLVHKRFFVPRFVTNISNRNDVDINNHVFQSARSGNVTVSGNTRGGSAMSGRASNSSSISTTVTINNN